MGWTLLRELSTLGPLVKPDPWGLLVELTPPRGDDWGLVPPRTTRGPLVVVEPWGLGPLTTPMAIVFSFTNRMDCTPPGSAKQEGRFWWSQAVPPRRLRYAKPALS